MKTANVLFLSILITYTSFSDPVSVRWTGKEDPNANIIHILEALKTRTGIPLSPTDFITLESRTLATSHFLMLNQANAGIPVRGQSIRIWTNLKTGEVIQAEARIDKPALTNRWDTFSINQALSSESTVALARSVVKKNPDDPFVRSIHWKDFWIKGVLTREVVITGKRGKHFISIGIESGKVLSFHYKEFPQADLSIPVQVYPIYEEVEDKGILLPRIPSELRYLKTHIQRLTQDVYEPLRKVTYLVEKFNPLLGLTEAGRKQGYWAMPYVFEQARQLNAVIPLSANDFSSVDGVVLEGRYATVSLHPDAAKVPNLSFIPRLSKQLIPTFVASTTNPDHEEMVPVAALLGKPLTRREEAWNRPARRLPVHDVTTYMNDGFDELQVYWSITQMFETLRASGFTDPDLGSRPFNAFLFNPDISYRDNAYYTDDTINFTTYSAKAPNMARDNTTIWHELGHGVMDRLMGEQVELADTGGLSEGMADFVAQLIVNDITAGLNFEGKDQMRIFNNTGFYLTNEVHDDGEAYGGAMNDLLVNAMASQGRLGLVKVTDLTLEAMRLTRNHPGLTAIDWFNHMLFADEIGSSRRKPGELKPFILGALNNRNFVFGTETPASFLLKNSTEEVVPNGLGSRQRPIKVNLKATESQTFTVNFQVKNSPIYKFKFPVTVQVELKSGPLQGGIHWAQEETNPLTYTLRSEEDVVNVPLTATGCDEINRPDNSCVDYAYVKVFNDGEVAKKNGKPQAKKRFYLRVYPQP